MTNQLTHLGFIADGNRRWAKEQGLPTLEGHRKGSKVVEMIIEELASTDVKYASFFIFSTENWGRSQEEIDYLMGMVASEIDRLTKKAQKYNMRIAILGRPEHVDPKIWQDLMESEASTKDNTGLTVCFCFNYGGQWEIADAAKKMAESNDRDYTPESFRNYLYHPEIPDCDFVVRTSGEERTSGFMLWRAAYAEFLFMDKYFPAFTKEDLKSVIDEYNNRQRRFGK